MKKRASERRALTIAEIKRADELDALMKKHNINATQLGECINRSRYTVHSYRAKRRPITVQLMRALHRVFSECV